MKYFGKKTFFLVCMLTLGIIGIPIFMQWVIVPSMGHFLINRGNYYFGGGTYNTVKAAQYYKWATYLDRDMPHAHYQLSRIYFVEGKNNDALREVNATIALAPDFGRAYYMRGLIYGYTKKLDEAETDFKKILELGELEPGAGKLGQGGWAVYNDLAWIQFQKGSYADVEVSARQGLEKYPDNPWLLNSLGLALLNLEKKEEARATFEQALQKAEELTVEDVRRAYPGNDPLGAEDKRQAIIGQIKFNKALVVE